MVDKVDPKVLEKIKADHPELYKKDAVKESPEIIPDEEPQKLKSISPIISQIALRKLGMYCSERMNIDIYYLLEAINLLVSEVGEDFLIRRYKAAGKDWNNIKLRLDEINMKVTLAKTFYDPIADKKFSKPMFKKNVNEVEDMFKSYFFKTASKISLMQRDLYDIFVFLASETTIQRQQIKTEAFKVLEHQGFRTLENKKSSPSNIGVGG